MVGRVGVTGQYLMTDFKKQANIQMSPNDEGHVLRALLSYHQFENHNSQSDRLKSVSITSKKDEV